MRDKILSETKAPEFGRNMRFLDIHSIMEKYCKEDLENLGKIWQTQSSTIEKTSRNIQNNPL